MMKSKRFEPIREIVSRSAQELSKTMGDAARRVADLDKQFEQLKNYRDEYVRNSSQTSAIDAVKLQNYRAFLDRLGDAMRQHVIKLEVARADYEKRRQQWSEKRVEAESLGRAIDHFRKEEHQIAEQREQKEGDDAAMRISLARLEAGNS
jgi:flagellar export protein FliJ